MIVGREECQEILPCEVLGESSWHSFERGGREATAEKLPDSKAQATALQLHFRRAPHDVSGAFAGGENRTVHSEFGLSLWHPRFAVDLNRGVAGQRTARRYHHLVGCHRRGA